MTKRKDYRHTRNSVLGIEIILSVILCVVAVMLFLALSEAVFRNILMDFDNKILKFVSENQTPALTRFTIFISGFGSSIFFLTASAVVAIYLYFRNKIDSFIFVVILYSAVILNIFLKYYYNRPRPEFDALVIENSNSYPSFHAMISLVLYSAIAYVIYKSTKNVKLSILISVLFGILILLIGLSRLYLGVHYPSDVLAGYVAGFIWIIIVILIQRTLVLEKIYNKSNRTK